MRAGIFAAFYVYISSTARGSYKLEYFYGVNFLGSGMEDKLDEASHVVHTVPVFVCTYLSLARAVNGGPYSVRACIMYCSIRGSGSYLVEILLPQILQPSIRYVVIDNRNHVSGPR